MSGFRPQRGPFWLRYLANVMRQSKGQCSPETIQAMGQELIEHADEWESQVASLKAQLKEREHA